MGRCPGCGEWNTIVQSPEEEQDSTDSQEKPAGKIITLSEAAERAEKSDKISTKDSEFDLIAGGGLTPGAVVLIGGEPGVGKSTLVLGIAAKIASPENKVIYVSAEESIEQVAARATRMKAVKEGFYLLNESRVDRIINAASEHDPAIIVVDSIQTVSDPSGPGSTGTPAQVRYCTDKFVNMAKSDGGPVVILIGHVTKDGALAGPRVLEHQVDTVMMFEGDRTNAYRILRTGKNRFGPSDGVAFYHMQEEGLIPVPDPSVILLAGRRKNASGTQVTSVMEGNRPVLAEIQALVSQAYGGVPGRGVTGLDPSRCMMILAVLNRRCGLSLSGNDLWINVAGGYKINETSADLSVAAAVASSLKDIPLCMYTVAMGELSLTGELRPVHQMTRRLEEAKRVGFKKAVVPASCSIKRIKGIEIIKAAEVSEAVDILLQNGKSAVMKSGREQKDDYENDGESRF